MLCVISSTRTGACPATSDGQPRCRFCAWRAWLTLRQQFPCTAGPAGARRRRGGTAAEQTAISTVMARASWVVGRAEGAVGRPRTATVAFWPEQRPRLRGRRLGQRCPESERRLRARPDRRRPDQRAHLRDLHRNETTPPPWVAPADAMVDAGQTSEDLLVLVQIWPVNSVGGEPALTTGPGGQFAGWWQPARSGSRRAMRTTRTASTSSSRCPQRSRARVRALFGEAAEDFRG